MTRSKRWSGNCGMQALQRLSVTNRTEAHIANGHNQLHMSRWRQAPSDQPSHVHDEGILKLGEVIMADRCTTCGEAIPEGEAEFDGDDGRIGRPHHPVCLSMPESLKAKLSRCPACGHMEGSHMDVTAFDAFTGKIRATHTACSCGCKYYLTPRGVG